MAEQQEEGLLAKQPHKSVTLEAVVIRADGTREELGTIAYWHRNPLRRLFYRLTHRRGGRIRVH
jgi:hypothetical protein